MAQAELYSFGFFPLKLDGFGANGYFPVSSFGNGNLGGDFAFMSRTTDTLSKRSVQKLVHVDPFTAALLLELSSRRMQSERSVAQDHRERLEALTEKVQSGEVLDELIDELLTLERELEPAINIIKVEEARFVGQALDVLDVLDPIDEGALLNRLVGIKLRSKEREAELGLSIASALEVKLKMVGEQLRAAREVTWELEAFLRERTAIRPSDLPELHVICRKVKYKPTSQLVSYIYSELERGGGEITDPVVMRTIREAFLFGGLIGSLVAPIRPLASMTAKKAVAAPGNLSEVFVPQVMELSRKLRELSIGGPFDEVIEQAFKILKAIDQAMKDGNWGMAIKAAQQYKFRLIYRCGPDHQNMKLWYGHWPPLLRQPDDPFEGLP